MEDNRIDRNAWSNYKVALSNVATLTYDHMITEDVEN